MYNVKRWSSLEDEILVTGFQQNRQVGEIASRLGRRDGDVSERAVELGLRIPPTQSDAGLALAA